MRRDRDFELVRRLSASVHREYQDPGADAWANSPFAWIRASSSARKGAVGRKLVRAWAESEGRRVSRASGGGHAFRIDELRVVVKLSLEWDGGLFVFEQLRDELYDVACLLGLEPHRAQLWCVPKQILLRNAPGQHTGRRARETQWLQFHRDDPPAWLSAYGGGLAQASAALEEARRQLGD